MQLQKHMGDNTPNTIEYLGKNEWAVRWGVSEIQSENMRGFEYYELKFDEQPTYDLFVSKLIRIKYSIDQEEALKSNIIAEFMGGETNLDHESEWHQFQQYREEVKVVGKRIFDVKDNV